MMAASERARRLIDAYRIAVLIDAASGKAQRDPNAPEAALLAYVADLEACVDAARHHLTESRGPVHLIALREAEMALADCLAALDRPEDGE